VKSRDAEALVTTGSYEPENGKPAAEVTTQFAATLALTFMVFDVLPADALCPMLKRAAAAEAIAIFLNMTSSPFVRFLI
jgi:hypothetical protein